MGDGDSGLSRLRVGPTSLEGCYGPLRERCLGDWQQGMRGLKILDLKGMFLRAWEHAVPWRGECCLPPPTPPPQRLAADRVRL